MRSDLTRAAGLGDRDLRAGEQLWGRDLVPRPRQPERPKMRLLAWRRVGAGSFVGAADIELPIGLRLYGVSILRGSSGPWAALPTAPQIDRGTRRQRAGADGRPIYARVAEWRTRDLAARWSAAVIELVRAAHPDALDEAAPAAARQAGPVRPDGVPMPELVDDDPRGRR